MRAASSFALLTSITLLASCGGPAGPSGVDDAVATKMSLLGTPTASLDIPQSSRPGGEEPADVISLVMTWSYAGTNSAGMHKWSTQVPIRPRGLFFHNAQPGMTLSNKSGENLRYDRFGKSEKEYWSYNLEKVFVYRKDKGDEPKAGDYTFTYPRAGERERELNFSLSAKDDKNDFVRAEIHEGWDTRNGLLLPAPGKATWDVTVPQAGELLLSPGLVAPEVLDAEPSDGATLVISVDVNGERHEVLRRALQSGKFDAVRADLSKWSGQQAKIIFETLPGENSVFDYAFIGEPQLASVKKNPQRVLLIFVDTLRPDHMSLYGYERDTSKMLDEWAKDAAVFENARSVAPWTLPSARTVLTGRHPEYYQTTDTLPKILSDEGYVTAMFAGNVYLSTNFEMARDWGLHRVGMWPSAESVTNDALAWMDDWEGHDTLLQVHYMDAHLPYLEPGSYRFMYAGEAKGGLREEFHLSDVRRVKPRTPEVRGYIQDRYDNNIRYATNQVDRLLQRMDDDDIVVFYADHGEEFWDHGGFEHGHHLFDELLKVPLVIKAPGVSGTRVSAQASLLDITPTIIEALGIEHAGVYDGVSLLSAAKGEAGGDKDLLDRDLAFGRPLYGTERWGVLTRDNMKWTTNEGREALYDLTKNPGEDNKSNLVRNQPPEMSADYRLAFGEALGVDVGVGYRLVATAVTGGPAKDDMVAYMTIPGGVKAAWPEHDPLGRSEIEITVSPSPDSEGDDIVRAVWNKSHGGEGIVWVIPKKPLEEVTHGIEVTAEMNDLVSKCTVSEKRPKGLTQYRMPLAMAQFKQRVVRLTFGITAIPNEDMSSIVASDPEVNSELEALGYMVNDENTNAKPHVLTPQETALLKAERERREQQGSEPKK